jgi:glyoxylase-like metal-dependent hydrolase (beta-lactamase superfamily II)
MVLNHKLAPALPILALMLCFGGEVQAEEGGTPTAAAFKMKVGAVEVASLHDNSHVVANDGKTFGLDEDPQTVSVVLKSAGAPTDSITVQFGGLLVKDGSRVMLIDTGAGPSLKGVLMGSVKEAGVAPDQITDVLITHSHADHVGGLVRADGKLAFPNAAVRMTAREWMFMQANKDLTAITEAIKGKVSMFEPGAKISEHVKAVPLQGHTPGHTGYEIVSGEAKLLDIGDVAHSSIVSLAHPEWAIGFDADKALGVKQRTALLQSLSQSHELIFAPHFPFPALGHIEAQEKGYVWKPMASGSAR